MAGPLLKVDSPLLVAKTCSWGFAHNSMKTGIAEAAIAAPPTTNRHLIRWVEKMADLTQPEHIHWCDGSQAEYDALCNNLEEGGTFTRLNQELWPGCFLARSDARDVARVEDR